MSFQSKMLSQSRQIAAVKWPPDAAMAARFDGGGRSGWMRGNRADRRSNNSGDINTDIWFCNSPFPASNDPLDPTQNKKVYYDSRELCVILKMIKRAKTSTNISIAPPLTPLLGEPKPLCRAPPGCPHPPKNKKAWLPAHLAAAVD